MTIQVISHVMIKLGIKMKMKITTTMIANVKIDQLPHHVIITVATNITYAQTDKSMPNPQINGDLTFLQISMPSYGFCERMPLSSNVTVAECLGTHLSGLSFSKENLTEFTYADLSTDVE